MPRGWARFWHELRSTLRLLALYGAALAALAIAGVMLVGDELISLLAAADQRLEWIAPRSPASANHYHASLKPRLRGTLD